MQNEVFQDKEGIIHHVYHGDQSYDIIQNDLDKIGTYARSLRKNKKRVIILGNYTDIGRSDAGARKAASDALKEMEYDKVALFGTNLYHTVAANLIIIASGKGRKIRLFTSKEKALKWLRK